jgi:hypothetical protein
MRVFSLGYELSTPQRLQPRWVLWSMPGVATAVINIMKKYDKNFINLL